MVAETITLPKKEIRWTQRLIKRLRGKRTFAEFGTLLGVPRNTVRRWEIGKSQPDDTEAERLSELAEREHFLRDWRLVGSMSLLGDLESAKAEIAELFRRSLGRTGHQLTE